MNKSNKSKWNGAWTKIMFPCLIKISAKNPSNSDGKDGIPSRGVALALKTSTAACSQMWNLLYLYKRSAFTCQHDSKRTHIDYRYMHYTSVTVHSHVPANACTQTFEYIRKRKDPVMMITQSKF